MHYIDQEPEHKDRPHETWGDYIPLIILVVMVVVGIILIILFG